MTTATGTVTVHTPDGDTAGAVELPAEVFDVQANLALMHQVVVAQLAAARRGTHDTKTRGEVAGGGRKPYRQKGTGRARQGSVRAPQFAGGGIVHGPTPRNYAQRTPKKMKAAALRGALSDRARSGRLHVLSEVVAGDTPSTKAARKAVQAITDRGRVLVVLGRDDLVSWQSLRNLTSVHLLSPDQLNTYDVLVADHVVFTKDALQAFLAAGGRELTELADAPAAKPAKAKAKESKAEEPAKPAKKADADKPEKSAKPAKAEPEATAKADKTGDADDQHPFGQDSHAALADGEQPDGFPVKASRSSKRYHVPGSSFYKRTTADVWFSTAEAAEAAGFELPPSQRKKTSDEEAGK